MPRTLAVLALLLTAPFLSGCIAVSAGSAVVGTTVGVTTTVVGTTVKGTGAVVGGAVDLVIPDGDDDSED